MKPDALAASTPEMVANPARRWALLATVGIGLAVVGVLHRQAAPETDDIGAAESEARAAHLASLGPLRLEALRPDQANVAAHRLLFSNDGGTAALVADVASQRSRIVLLTLYDSNAEDGDVVEVRSGGFSQVVPLFRKPVVVAVPIGADNQVTLVGSVDGGGGGVTIGLMLPSGPVPLPPLSVGQALRLPIAPG